MKKNFIIVIASVILILSVYLLFLSPKEKKSSANLPAPTPTMVITKSSDVRMVVSTEGYSDEIILYEEKHEPETAVLEMLSRMDVERALNLITKDSGFGTYIVSMAGCGGDDGRFWLYYINGESAQVGAGEYVLQEGDEIEWKCEEPQL